ncbi:MAG: class I SAM-dependent methyltransferase [Ignavibacteriales bacterium]|nr:class I SAM-dependent methyltransferase [Ignavibacteriales bacterium]
MKDYYSDKLSAKRLERVYEIAPVRVKQYFEAEINHVLQKIQTHDLVLELGCGYGRILPSLAKKAKSVFGIDTSLSSLLLGKETLSKISNCSLAQMNAVQLSFPNNIFDVVVCIQNGISAFHVNQKELILESLRVTKPNGIVLFSSYSEKSWNDRLEWFRLQSDNGLLGEIDYEKTINGNIVCKDGFTATTVGIDQFKALTSDIDNVIVNLEEVDDSSIFCEIISKHCLKQ